MKKPLTAAASHITHPGITTRAAKAAGVSTHEKEEEWAHTKGNSAAAKKSALVETWDWPLATLSIRRDDARLRKRQRIQPIW